MGKLDFESLRYLKKEDLRILAAVEIGMKNHEFVPSKLLDVIANCKGARIYNNIKNLCRQKLLVYEKKNIEEDALHEYLKKKVDEFVTLERCSFFDIGLFYCQGEGYRLTFNGYDALALNTFQKRGVITKIGSKIGVGKESDIFVATRSDGSRVVLKFHRLGRNSFRKVREKRDYMGKRSHCSWIYLSRLAALREFEFIKILHRNNFPVPKGIDQNRHCIVMELIDGFPMSQITYFPNPSRIYSECISLIVKLAEFGLAHGDFNEFNLIYIPNSENECVNGTVMVIDFPQMVSLEHENAKFYFDRDVKCICDFFKRKFNFYPKNFPVLDEINHHKALVGELAKSELLFEYTTELHNELEKEKNYHINSPHDDNNNNDDYDNDNDNDNDNGNNEDDNCDDNFVDSYFENNNDNNGFCISLTCLHEHTEEHLYKNEKEFNHNPNKIINEDDIGHDVTNERLEFLKYIIDHETNSCKGENINYQNNEPSTLTSTFTREEIIDRMKRTLKRNARIEAHKDAIKNSKKKADSQRSRMRYENRKNIKESMNEVNH